MLAAVISRDDGEPWGQTGMTTAKWLDIPTQRVIIADLIATQPGVLFHALITPSESHCGDPKPHVINWGGHLYLEDGHHRTVLALLAGATTIEARVLTVNGP